MQKIHAAKLYKTCMTEVMMRLLCELVAHQPGVVEGQGHWGAKRNSKKLSKPWGKRGKKVARCIMHSILSRDRETVIPHTSPNKTSDFGPVYLRRTDLDGDTGKGFGED